MKVQCVIYLIYEAVSATIATVWELFFMLVLWQLYFICYCFDSQLICRALDF